MTPLGQLIAQASQGLVDRASLVELVVLGAVAGEHLLVIGPPGTAKSQAVRAVASALGGNYFEYLLGRFTEPSEIFGPVDLRRLREGVVEVETAHMLPEAEIAFLDEVFLGSTAILNTLLALLNERRFRRGRTDMQCPLRICVGASNQLPTDPALSAFSDRFLLRIFVERTPDPLLEDLLLAGWGLRDQQAHSGDGMRDLRALSDRLSTVDMTTVRPALAEGFRRLRGAAIPLSDRRMVRSQRLVAAAALIDGRSQATDADLWPLYYVMPDAATQAAARDLLSGLWAQSRNQALGTAALEASAGPLARADRLIAAAKPLLDHPVTGDGQAGYRLRLEGIAREIDASFAPNKLPPGLAELRASLVARLT